MLDKISGKAGRAPLFAIAFMILVSGAAPACLAKAGSNSKIDNLRQSYIDSLNTYAPNVVLFADDDAAKNEAAYQALQAPAYSVHIKKYLDYYRALNLSYDIFQGILSDADIGRLERETRFRYTHLLRQIFRKDRIEGKSFFRFYLNPTSFFAPQFAQDLAISPFLTWDILFKSLQDHLPSDVLYSVTLKISAARPGGTYDPKTDQIVFGDYQPNIATFLGFVHEFGHSVFLIPDREDGRLSILATNEAYAETWANRMPEMPWILSLAFPNGNNEGSLRSYMEFRNLLTFRFSLMTLALGRSFIHENVTSPEKYVQLQADIARKFLRADQFPPMVPILPQSITPGYVEAYGAIPFLISFFKNDVGRLNVVSDLVQLGPTMEGDRDTRHYQKTLEEAVRNSLQEH